MEIRQEARAARSSEHSLINFVWLLKLRWAAAIGQLGTVLSVELLLGVELPLGILFGLIGFEAFSNLLFTGWLRAARRRGGWTVEAVPTALALVAAVMVLDLLLLTALLYVSGGPSNPFSLFYLVNVLLASLLLPAVWGWAMAGFGVLCFGFLFYAHEPLAGLAAHRWRPLGRGDERSLAALSARDSA